MSMIVRLWRWEYMDEWTGRRIKTRHHATAEHFLAAHPDAVRIPGTEEIREISDPFVLAAAQMRREGG